MKKLKKKVVDTITQEEGTKKKARLVEEKALRVVEDYKNLFTFEDEVIKAGAFSFEIGFNNCKEKVKEFFLGLDFCKVVAGGEEAIIEGDEEG